MVSQCIKYIIKKGKQYYSLYSKNLKTPKQPTIFIVKGKDLEGLVTCDNIAEESRAELIEKGKKLKPGQEASVMYEHYSGFS